MKNTIAVFILVFVLSGCDSRNKKTDTYSNMDASSKVLDHPGKVLMETNCYTCHSPTARGDSRIGPPMIAIKKHYIGDQTTKEEFVASIQAWIKNPNKDVAKMYGAVRRFGLMPKQYFPEETIAKIADYIYDFDIEQPKWFEDHFSEEMGKGKVQGMKKNNKNKDQ